MHTTSERKKFLLLTVEIRDFILEKVPSRWTYNEMSKKQKKKNLRQQKSVASFFKFKNCGFFLALHIAGLSSPGRVVGMDGVLYER